MISFEPLRRSLICGTGGLLLICGASARADYQSETGMVQVVTPPPSVRRGAFESNTEIRTFVEGQRITLGASVTVDNTASGTFTGNGMLVGGTIAAGTSVDSYFFHSDPASANKVYTGTVTFTTAILGVIVLSNSLSATDAQLGHPGTLYPVNDSARGLELSSTQDFFTLSADMKTLTLHFNTHDNVDEIRVLTAPTAVPEPTSLALLGLGGLAVAGVTRRASRRA